MVYYIGAMIFSLLFDIRRLPARDDIYIELRGIEHDGLDRSIDTWVANLCKKSGGSTSLNRRILTVHNPLLMGYSIAPRLWHFVS